MCIDNEHWFTEPCEPCGSAISLRIEGRLHQEQTPFQEIEIYQTRHYGRLMVIDGCVMLTDRDNFIYHEMMVHPALYCHPDPQRVLVVGGGDCGSLREVLRHSSVIQVDQVEIDERVTRLSEQFFPQLCEANDDPRASLHFADGIAWVEDSPPGRYQVILIDSTDPVGPAQGLFAEPFYRQCRRVLGEDGILVQQSESPLLHLDTILAPMHHALQEAGFEDTLSLHFPLSTYPGGWWSATLAGPGSRIRAPREFGKPPPFPTRYYNAAIHRAAMAQPPFLLERGLG